MQRELVSDQALWGRVPGSASAVLLPLEALLLGWGTGWWVALITVPVIGMGSVLLPPRLPVSIYAVDLLERLLRLPLRLCWLLLVADLWLREPLLPVFGQPLIGALAATAALFALTPPLALAGRLAAKRIVALAV